MIREVGEGNNFLHYSTIRLDEYRILVENELIELELLEINQELQFKNITSRKEIPNIK